MWSAAILIGGFALITQRWSYAGHFVIAGMLVIAVASLMNRIRLGSRIPGWLNHADAVAGTVFTSTAILLDGRDIGEFAMLYILIGLFVSFFMTARSAITYGGVIVAAYGGVLWLSPSAPDALGHWVTLAVVLAVSEVVVMGLTTQMRDLASRDPLTGLPNRREWDGRLSAELVRAGRRGRGLSVAILDLNGFKEINDREGHLGGDRLLIKLAAYWRRADRPSGAFLARLGGDEFGLLMPGSGALDVEVLAEQLGAALPHGVSFSVGAVTWDGTETAAELVSRADRKMYAMKESCRTERDRRKGRKDRRVGAEPRASHDPSDIDVVASRRVAAD